MEKKYNKLVRDFIPDIIKEDNEVPIVRILGDDEYRLELEKKLFEEYHEVLAAKDSKQRIEELADMLEIIKYLAALESASLDDVIEKANEKKLKRGGFDKKIFLEKTIKE